MSKEQFSGNIFIFHAFDVGDDINLEKVKKDSVLIHRPYNQPKYFKHYHLPLSVELPHPHESAKCVSVKIYNFGAISFLYKIPFEDSLENVRMQLVKIDNQFREQSIIDGRSVFNKIKKYIKKSKFFLTQSSYVIIQVNPKPNLDVQEITEQYGGIIASLVRFETETLSEYKKNAILESSIGYLKGDLIVIDAEASFVYDPVPEEILDIFEFANIQQLELRFFDRLLDQKLNKIYEEDEAVKIPISAYIPIIGTLSKGPIDELARLKVDISVIAERLEGAIRLVGEPYFAELYGLLNKQLDLKNLRESITKKLSIIRDIQQVWQQKLESVHEGILTILIIILIFIELVVGLFR